MISITGFSSPVAVTRSNRREISFFVNKRPVQDIALTTALIQAYHTMLMVGRYPMAVIFLDMSPELVDVNVHPTKAEVRFREPDRVFRAVQNSIRRALLAHTPVPEFTQSPYWQPPESSNIGRSDGLNWTEAIDIISGEEMQSPEHSVESGMRQAEILSRSTKIPLLRLVGQVASAFIVAEGPDGLYLIDQHAAHERVLFEKMMSQYNDSIQSGSHIPAQALLSPVIVDLSPANARMLADQIRFLGKFGFQVEEFGSDTFLVRSIPLILTGMDPNSALRVLVEEFEEDEAPLQKEVEARMIARVCKRAAVKAGKMLSIEEQRALISDLEMCESPRTCPHGRPTMIHLSVDLLERQFGRRGAR
jgi:DNA mismatch repair protein MutL